jgi:hypothetical protein
MNKERLELEKQLSLYKREPVVSINYISMSSQYKFGSNAQSKHKIGKSVLTGGRGVDGSH